MTLRVTETLDPPAGDRAAPDRFAAARAKLFPPLRSRALAQAADALGREQPDAAERILRRYLEKRADDPDALTLMADIERRRARFDEAERLLSRAVALSPDHPGYRFNFAVILRRRDKFHEALAELDAVLADDPHNPLARDQKAAILPLLGRHQEALDLWRALTEDYPDWPEAWLQYGHALRRMGFAKDAIAAWRRALALRPKTVAAYANLSDLKTYRFAESEIAAMNHLLADPQIGSADRARLHFALGRAEGDERRYSRSFEHYAKANALLRSASNFDAGRFVAFRQSCERLFAPEFFRAREGWGCPSRAPIFIVGLPRSGSTLVEQILSSHSAIEGLGEMVEFDMAVGRKLSAQTGRPSHELWIGGHFEFRSGLVEEFAPTVAGLDAGECRALGEAYVAAASRRKVAPLPRFTDKGLRNFAYAGLIHLVLPHAAIVDVRRHPLDCGWSQFRSHFPGRQPFSERLSDIGNYYRNYVGLMAHFDRVLPGRIHRILYENLVADPQGEIGRLLARLDLPFEEECLRFHANKRAVATISSEQVRKPLYDSGIAQWQPYEPWLGPLKAALGAVLEAWPDAPPDGDF